jgi:PAS domain S-box-containing protein
LTGRACGPGPIYDLQSAISDPEGQPPELELEVQRWKDRYEAAIRASGCILYDLERATGTVAFEGSLKEVLGYAPDELAGPWWRWLELIHPEDQAAFVRDAHTAWALDLPFRREYRLRRKDGSWAVVLDKSQAIRGPTGGSDRVLGFVLDMTERRQLEAQYRQSQKMEALGRLAGGVAHDFNNLLTIINGYTELLLTRSGAAEPDRAPLVQIKEAGQRAAGLTRQLLAFSRKQVIEPRILQLDQVVQETESLLRRLIGEDIELVVVAQASIAPILADPTQLQQVLFNLAVNARDAMPQGGRLSIETRNAWLNEIALASRPGLQPGRYVELIVTDTGHGMTDEVKARIFEPFFTTKEAGKGTGLGLATVYAIVQSSGGFIEFTSELERGTSFRIYLPQAQAPATTVERPRSALDSKRRRGGETILVAEDEEGVRSLIVQVLQMNGYTVLAACNGADALRLCEQHASPIHLVISDLVMPHLGGRELVDRLQARRPTLQALFLSGYTDDALIVRGLSVGEIAFLEKPFSPDALARKVRELLDQDAAPPA